MSQMVSSDARVCVVCRRSLPIERFHASGHGNGRRRTCTRCMAERGNQERRARKAPVRHARYNARGQVWCNRCERYLHREDFKPHPSRPGTLWSYCKPCTRELDRERYAKRTSTLQGAMQELKRTNDRKRELRARRQRERQEFVQNSIKTLLRRGFTKAEICRLADVSFASLLDWERGSRRVTPAVEDRLLILVLATAHIPLGEPAYKRRLPHPEYERIYARVHQRIVAIPVRNSWKNGRKSA